MSLVIPAPVPVTVPVSGGAPGAAFPVTRIYCVGRNYVEHAKEMGFTGREPPFFFMKPADAVLVVPEGETGRMHYPTQTANLHHEVELVVAIGKGFDESAPIGPLVSAARWAPTPDTPIELEVNGVVRQRSTLGKLIWSLPEIIEHVSAAWTLQPGDLIFTGTPEGVGAVVSGDLMVCRVGGLPDLRVQIVD